MTVNRLVLEWEEKMKLHQEYEMEFNRWRNKNFKNERPAPIKIKDGVDDEVEVTLYLTRKSLEVLRKFHWMILGTRFNQLSHIIAASAIAISSDSLNESMGSPPSQVIFFGGNPTVIPFISMVAPETSTTTPIISFAAPVIETIIVASSTRLCGLVPYSDSDSDSPDEMDSLEYITPLPATSPFLYIDSPEVSDSFDGWLRILKKMTKLEPKPDKIRLETKSVEKSKVNKSQTQQSQSHQV
nr:hypothetical protein [Tanacetum cinerariifolium]